MKTYSGLVAAPGIGIGHITVYLPDLAIGVPLGAHPQRDVQCDPDTEWQRFLGAQAAVDAELEQLCGNPNSLVADIFAAHRVMLHDTSLLNTIRSNIYEHSQYAVTAVFDAISDLSKLFASFETNTSPAAPRTFRTWGNVYWRN